MIYICYTERVSHMLLSMDSKIVEQTRQIKDIFCILRKKHDDDRLSMIDEVKKVY